jgi:hypothetical protein
MDPWIKLSTTIKSSGEKTIRYESFRNPNMIESRKMAIPHSGRSGFWYRTTFFLIRPDGTEKEFYSLRAAKEAAEKEGLKNDPV